MPPMGAPGPCNAILMNHSPLTSPVGQGNAAILGACWYPPTMLVCGGPRRRQVLNMRGACHSIEGGVCKPHARPLPSSNTLCRCPRKVKLLIWLHECRNGSVSGPLPCGGQPEQRAHSSQLTAPNAVFSSIGISTGAESNGTRAVRPESA